MPSVTYIPPGLTASGGAAAAGTLTGSTLASGVTASSLTSVGTIATGDWQGTDVGVAYGGTGASTLTANGILVGNGTSAVAVTATMVTKGHLMVGDGSGVPSMLAVGGTNDHVLTVDSGEATGVKWAAAGSGSGAVSAIISGPVENELVTIGSTTTELDAESGLIYDGTLYIGDSANGNMTTGLTINQGAADDQILAFKSSDPSGGHGLTTGTAAKDVEDDDYMTFGKQNADKGGIQINVVAKSDLADPFFLETYGGPPATNDVSYSSAAMQFYVGEHDGSNALVDMAADSNAFAWGEIGSNGGRNVRMLLKADDGQLHLGNTLALVALDNEDDRQIIRAIQKEGSSSGIIESKWDNPFYDYDKLHELGLAGEKDEEGFFLFPVQSRLHAHEGAMWQNYTEIRGMQEKIDTLENRLLAIEGA